MQCQKVLRFSIIMTKILKAPQALCLQFLLVTFCFLQVLETCVNNCGDRFHSEMAKFRFLNELIKVLSPKVGDGGYRAFQDKKCSSAAQRQWDLLAILLFVGVGLGLPETPCRHRTHQFPFLVDPAHIYHWYTFHFPLHQPKGRAAKSSFQRNAQLRNKTPCLSQAWEQDFSETTEFKAHITEDNSVYCSERTGII